MEYYLGIKINYWDTHKIYKSQLHDNEKCPTERLYAIWFYFYEILQKTKLFNRKQIIVPRMWACVCVCVCVCVLSPSRLLATLGDCSPPASSVHGIFHTRILEWVPISSSRGSSWPRDRTCVPWIGRKILSYWATEEGFWLQTGTKGLFVEMQLFNIMIMEACKRNEYSCQNIELYI